MKPKIDVETSYPYRGVPLAPRIVAELTKELFAGKLVTRQNIVDQVSRAHLKRGGLPSKRGNIRSSIDEALRMLQKEGAVENPSRGYWKILPTNTAVTAEEPQLHEISVSPIDAVGDVFPDDSLADTVIGEGPA
jgi:restriction endonuclease Mrr